jgi:hypothetical protein
LGAGLHLGASCAESYPSPQDAASLVHAVIGALNKPDISLGQVCSIRKDLGRCNVFGELLHEVKREGMPFGLDEQVKLSLIAIDPEVLQGCGKFLHENFGGQFLGSDSFVIDIADAYRGAAWQEEQEGRKECDEEVETAELENSFQKGVTVNDG